MELTNVMAIIINSIGSMFFIFVGLLFFGVGLWGFLQEYNTTQWNMVQGIVTNSSVLRTHDSHGVMYQADISYNYTYKGNSYNGHCCGYSTSDQWGMEKLSREYTSGGTAELYVNPESPYQSRLKNEVNPFGISGIISIVFMGLGGLAALTGLWNLIAGFRRSSVPPQ